MKSQNSSPSTIPIPATIDERIPVAEQDLDIGRNGMPE